MGMLLYMMELEAKEAAAKAASKPAPKVEPKPEVKQEEPKAEAKKLTRAEIMKMNVATVRAYAEEQGIEGASAMSGAELKRILVNKMFEDED